MQLERSGIDMQAKDAADGRALRSTFGIDAVENGEPRIRPHAIVENIPIPRPDTVPRRKGHLQAFGGRIALAFRQHLRSRFASDAEHAGDFASVVKSGGNRWLDERAARERDLVPGQYVSMCVSDNGTGMDADVVAKAFDPFFTTKPIGQGTGLGLSMIYGFARQSGGQVRIYSEVGRGTMVCIYLPRHQGDAENVEALADLAAAPKAEKGETVLVVDDEPTVRMLVTEVLEELGYAAIEAADSPSGLKVLQSDVRIDLLVTDVGLLGGMNGRQMADAARASRPDLKVLFITGYAENAVVGQGPQLVVDWPDIVPNNGASGTAL